MKIKTFVAYSPAEIDGLVNDFECSHRVRATQTEAVFLYSSQKLMYRYTVFYDDEVQK